MHQFCELGLFFDAVVQNAHKKKQGGNPATGSMIILMTLHLGGKIGGGWILGNMFGRGVGAHVESAHYTVG